MPSFGVQSAQAAVLQGPGTHGIRWLASKDSLRALGQHSIGKLMDRKLDQGCQLGLCGAPHKWRPRASCRPGAMDATFWLVFLQLLSRFSEILRWPNSGSLRSGAPKASGPGLGGGQARSPLQTRGVQSSVSEDGRPAWKCLQRLFSKHAQAFFPACVQPFLNFGGCVASCASFGSSDSVRPASAKRPTGFETHPLRGGGGGRITFNLQAPRAPSPRAGGGANILLTIFHRFTIPLFM